MGEDIKTSNSILVIDNSTTHPSSDLTSDKPVTSVTPNSGKNSDSGNESIKEDDGTKENESENELDNLVVRNPKTNKTEINKSAYIKLQRNSIDTTRTSIDKFKEIFETPEVEVKLRNRDKPQQVTLKRHSAIKLDKHQIESIKNRYSPAALGYNKKPIVKPRTAHSVLFDNPPPKLFSRYSLRDENSNILLEESSEEEEQEFISIVTRSDSVKTVDKINEDLNLFTMDVKSKEKKRTSSFKKLFSGGFFGKDKKKKDEDKYRNRTVENVFTDNTKNESNVFSRDSSYRHTTGGEHRIKKLNSNEQQQKEQNYANQHINNFNRMKYNFEKPPEEYVDMDDSRMPKNYVKTPYIKKYIDNTSSSTSTTESNTYDNYPRTNQNDDEKIIINKSYRFQGTGSGSSRDTPPRAQETRQDVKLVNPKALIPINSERPLPNPYQNIQDDNRKSNNIKPEVPPKPHLVVEDTYGTVFDSKIPQKLTQKSRSPSLELTKLKLPPNREIVPLEPRVKSPLPYDKISAEKIIATELLKGTKSPIVNKKSPQQNHQRLEIDINYPDNQTNINGFVHTKPPPKPSRMKIPEQQELIRSPTPNNLLKNRSLSSPMNSIRSSTPVDSQSSISVKSSPQKDEIRKNVEAYCWREIKKMKEQEYNAYNYQMQNDLLNAQRRSRSVSPSVSKSRRSLSLPREMYRQENVQYVQGASGNSYIIQAIPIPENRTVINQMNPRNSLKSPTEYNNMYFVRNSPDRQTISGTPQNDNYENNKNSLYRPIFKRGSLTRQVYPVEDSSQMNKKAVSFSSSNKEEKQLAWPTKNGFTKSPPQRRVIEKYEGGYMEDDVFLPNSPREQEENLYGYNSSNLRSQPQRNQEIYYRIRPEPIYPTKSQMLQQNARQIQGIVVDDTYGQPVDFIRTPHGLTRHGSIIVHEPMYGERRTLGSRRMSIDSINFAKQNLYEPQYTNGREDRRREILVNDNEIFGTIRGYTHDNNNVRIVRPLPDPPRQNITMEPQYGTRNFPRQVSVRNKVCDMFGQIHDNEGPYGQIQKSGTLVGQLQHNSSSPNYIRNMQQQQIPIVNSTGPFVRGTRLTASANDINPRYYRNVEPRYQSDYVYNANNIRDVENAPNRPLPPVPINQRGLRNKDKCVSDVESDASEIQRGLNNSAKNKKRSFFGK